MEVSLMSGYSKIGQKIRIDMDTSRCCPSDSRFALYIWDRDEDEPLDINDQCEIFPNYDDALKAFDNICQMDGEIVEYLVEWQKNGDGGEAHLPNFDEALDKQAECFNDDASHVRISPIVACCGERLICDSFTTTCPTCGADYSNNGERLAPRSQWGEETGERF